MSRGFEHRPVMLDEIVDVFSTVPAGTVVDATLGGGGHSEALLESRPDVDILGIDADPFALAAARERLDGFGARLRTSHRRFDEFSEALTEHDLDGISGALFDLGVSSPQLDHAERGFAYRSDGPLDMRMNTEQEWSAADVVNGYDQDRLAALLRRNGDERFANRVARAICAARPVETTSQLASIVTTAIPAAATRTGGVEALAHELGQG